MYFGVDYYPEHWPRARWEIDVKLMREMGIDVVRMAEFSWASIEPEEGKFQFQWLEEAISLLAAHGIKTILGTPTAAPPAWLVTKIPDVFPVDARGVQYHFGGRHHTCHSNPDYRSYVKTYVETIAGQFAGNPHVVGWQIDNELGNSHGNLCFCGHCAARYRQWLQNKYGDVKTLNDAWGTVFWSQSYNDFSQVDPPGMTVAGYNPSAMLDWKRFCSDLIVDFMDEQLTVLRDVCPHQFVTHNAMGFADKVNYFDLAENLDFISHDQYPATHYGRTPEEAPASLAATLDFVRGIKNKTFWIMEQQSGITGWETMGRRPKPGQLALWAMQSVAHGADAIVFFRWRTCAVGTEQFWHGILPHCGRPGARYEELKRMIHTFRPVMSRIQGAMPKAEVGIVFSYDQSYALQIQPQHPDLNYLEQINRYYAGFYERNVPVDFVRDTDDFGRYKLLIAPLQFLMTPPLAEKYEKYVEDGGNLVLTMRTGVKDAHNLCYTETPLPGLLKDLLGIEVYDYDCLLDSDNGVVWDGKTYTAQKWSDLIQLADAKAAACYAADFYAGTPVVTVARRNGNAWYVGCEPGKELVDHLTDVWLRESKIEPLLDTPHGVEAVCRHSKDKDYLFILNHTGNPQKVEIPSSWKAEYMQGEKRNELGPYEVLVSTKI